MLQSTNLYVSKAVWNTDEVRHVWLKHIQQKTKYAITYP